MNVSHPTLQSAISEHRNKRLQALFGDPIEFITNLHKPKNYQSKIVSDTRRDILGGVHQGRWDIAGGGGKTYMSFAVMRHVVDRGGRVLYLAPGNTELKNAMDSHTDKYCLGEDNLMKFHSEDDITGIKDPKQRKFYDSVPYHYSTGQMLIYDERFRKIPADYYDLIIYDESQGFLGDQMSNPKTYFWGASIDMSATPYNNTKHVGSFTPHVYGEVSSEYLIEYHGYPDWRVKNYQIDEGVPEDEIDGELDFERNSSQYNLLNISERFLILESIFEEIIISGIRKGLAFMPSVADAELFVKHIVPNNPLLAGKVDFVAGKCSDSHNYDVEKRLRKGDLKIVLCKNKWNRSLDIPDITDIILNDPTRSLEITSQRIYRGARPSPGKDFLRIHDLLSSLFHSEQVGIPAVNAGGILKGNKITKRYGSSVKFSEDVSPEFIAALHRRRSMDLIGVTSKELELRREVKDSYFLSDVNFAIQIFSCFASQVFHIHPYQLLRCIDRYRELSETLTVSFESSKIDLTFAQFLEIIEFYGSEKAVLEYDYLSNIAAHISGGDVSDLDKSILCTRNDTVRDIDSILQANDAEKSVKKLRELPPTYLGDVDGNYNTVLTHEVQRLGGKVGWIHVDKYPIRRNEARRLKLDTKKNNTLYSCIVWVEIDGEVYECGGDIYSQSKQRAKRYASMRFLNQYRHLFDSIESNPSQNHTGKSPKDKNIGSNGTESYSQQFNNYIMGIGGRYETYFTSKGKITPGFYTCNFVVYINGKTLKVFGHTPCQGKKGAKENVAKFFLENIEDVLSRNSDKEEILMNEGNPGTLEGSTENATLRVDIDSGRTENFMQALNEFLQKFGGRCSDEYKSYERYKGGYSFTCTLTVKLGVKTITVSSDVRSKRKRRAKENIAKFFLENIKTYLQENTEISEFTMHEELEGDQFYGDDVPDSIEVDTDSDNVIELDEVIRNSKLKNVNDVLNIMKAKVLTKVVYSNSQEDKTIQARISVIGKNKIEYISCPIPYKDKDGVKEARLQASRDLYEKIKTLSAVQKFLEKWLNKN